MRPQPRRARALSLELVACSVFGCSPNFAALPEA
jgi:hypothetical protein